MVRVTVREERDGAAGDEEPATRSLASVRSTVNNAMKKRISRAEAATERSEGVAGAEQYRGPGPPAECNVNSCRKELMVSVHPFNIHGECMIAPRQPSWST